MGNTPAFLREAIAQLGAERLVVQPTPNPPSLYVEQSGQKLAEQFSLDAKFSVL